MGPSRESDEGSAGGHLGNIGRTGSVPLIITPA